MTVHTSADGLTLTGVVSTRDDFGPGWINNLFIGRRSATEGPGSQFQGPSGRTYHTDGPDRRPPPLRDVDPDSPHGTGSGWVGGPGLKEKAPDIVTARERAFAGFGPGIRPGDAGERTVAPPRLNVPGSLVGQPDPTNPRGSGSGPGYQGYNPNDFVNPPRPS